MCQSEPVRTGGAQAVSSPRRIVILSTPSTASDTAFDAQSARTPRRWEAPGRTLRLGAALASAGCLSVALSGCTSTPVVEKTTAGTPSLAYATTTVPEGEALNVATPHTRINAPAPEIRSLRPSAEQEQQIGGLVDRAYFLLLDGHVQAALDVLEEAKTMPYWAQSAYAPDVLFWTAHSYDRLEERAAAIVNYRQVVEHYPNAPLAVRATSRLRELRDGLIGPPVTSGGPTANVTANGEPSGTQ